MGKRVQFEFYLNILLHFAHWKGPEKINTASLQILVSKVYPQPKRMRAPWRNPRYQTWNQGHMWVEPGASCTTKQVSAQRLIGTCQKAPGKGASTGQIRNPLSIKKDDGGSITDWIGKTQFYSDTNKGRGRGPFKQNNVS